MRWRGKLTKDRETQLMVTNPSLQPRTWLRSTPLRYLGPFSPLGPWTSGWLFGVCLMLLAALGGPPVAYLIRACRRARARSCVAGD